MELTRKIVLRIAVDILNRATGFGYNAPVGIRRLPRAGKLATRELIRGARHSS